MPTESLLTHKEPSKTSIDAAYTGDVYLFHSAKRDHPRVQFDIYRWISKNSYEMGGGVDETLCGTTRGLFRISTVNKSWRTFVDKNKWNNVNLLATLCSLPIIAKFSLDWRSGEAIILLEHERNKKHEKTERNQNTKCSFEVNGKFLSFNCYESVLTCTDVVHYTVCTLVSSAYESCSICQSWYMSHCFAERKKLLCHHDSRTFVV